MFRLAHLTDPHVGPLPRPRLRQLLSKRAAGYVNWRRGRSRHHDMDLLGALIADLHGQGVDHVACTGDLCNLGLPDEWESARVFLEALGPADRVSFVPGNHDAYVRGSLEGLLAACGGWTEADDGQIRLFPYLRRRGPLALVGLSSAIPTKPFVASGRLGSVQIEAAERVLRDLATAPDRPCRVVMIHHPPHPGGAASGRELKDAAAFAAMIGRAGADLILHGHNHVGTVARITGPDGRPVPVVGAPSASARTLLTNRRASYYLYTVTPGENGFRIAVTERGLDEAGGIGELSGFDIETPPADRIGLVHRRRQRHT
ncbi:metallophosphoesterase family protein [Methylorubrum extorquens]|uniref:Metallophosphatase n=1 Tax=Methylorubrum extorquens TaxID=408 RepID=A0A1S1NZU2_METEX|nr:metallophosphoesterase [Methylorubrum extorquens]MCG5245739.1 metallophosphoesterase [Methylorubrum extorquens]OHV14920.1 metallophosphatase [Methylorubrum extorquens]UYW29381.1 metallophosphoesterase [Methylorubrum extorquens]UYW30917.1 metallophosphoesterase [Methylorubrum extorquens]